MENVLAAVREFLSTFSLRRATLELKPISNFGLISIHALLAESDTSQAIFGVNFSDFYPRSPCGERPEGASARVRPVIYFYPRSPCGERLPDSIKPSPRSIISIHALLAESDLRPSRPQDGLVHFYPRSPCGERLLVLGTRDSYGTISIHALLAESDTTVNGDMI